MSTARQLLPSIDPVTASLLEGAPMKGIIYGPVTSVSFGTAIGVNILGDERKICSFDCPYCEMGATTVRLNRLKRELGFPTPAEISEKLSLALQEAHNNGPDFDSIYISGNGEPTLHPDFTEVLQGIAAARKEWAPTKKILLYTNGSSLDNRKIVDSLKTIDGRILKFDAGNEQIFKAMNAPLSRTQLSRIISAARTLGDFTLVSTFVHGLVDNTSTAEIDDWIEAVALMKPKEVQITTIARRPAAIGVLRCSDDALYVIASKLQRKTQIRASVVVPILT